MNGYVLLVRTQIMHETDKAVLLSWFSGGGSNCQAWVPKWGLLQSRGKILCKEAIARDKCLRFKLIIPATIDCSKEDFYVLPELAD